MRHPGTDVATTHFMLAPSTPIYLLDTSQGLGSNQAHRVARDRQSRLWVASPVGLARFDGSTIDRWGLHTGLTCNGLRCLAIDASGQVWVGSDLGLQRLDSDGAPQVDPALQTWSFGLCQSIAIANHHVWAGTALGLVRLEMAPTDAGLQITFKADVGFVNDIASLSPTRIVAASAGMGLVESDGITSWPYRCEALAGRRITRIAKGFGDDLVVGTDSGLYIVDDARPQHAIHLGWPAASPNVTAIAVGEGLYWAAFGRQLVAYSTTHSGYPILENFQLESAVNDLLIDDLGNLWVATNNSGIAKVSCLRHAIRRIDLGGPGGVFGIKPVNQDTFTVGGDQVFCRVALQSGRPPTVIHRRQGLPDTIAWDSLEDGDGLWAATQAGLFYAKADEPFTLMYPQDPVLSAPNRVLLRHDGNLWVGTLRGLVSIRDGVCRIQLGDDAALGYIYALHVDNTGSLWVATLGRGLWRWSPEGGMHAVHPTPLRPDGNTYAIVQGPAGDHVILQDSMVILRDTDGQFRTVADFPPVAGWAAVWVDARTVAIGTSDGLRILDMVTAQVTHHVMALLPHRDWEFTNNRALVRDALGQFLCGLTNGLVSVNLDLLRHYAPPTCKLAGITWKGVQPTASDAGLLVRPGRWSLQLRAFAAWFVDSASVRYQFQLVGFDDHWSPWQDRPVVSFNSLPVGEYRLKVRAYAPLTGYGPVSELMHLRVHHSIWSTGWNAALMWFESVYASLVSSRLRNRDLLESNQALETAVRERTDSLLAANRELESIRDAYKRLSELDPLTQLGNRRYFDRELIRMEAMAKRLTCPLALMVIDVDHFKAVNDRYGHPTGDEYLRRVAQAMSVSMRKGQDVGCRYGGEEFAIILMNTHPHDAAQCAEKVRAAVLGLALPNLGAGDGYLTASIGVAVLMPGSEWGPDELVKRADLALYRAKRNGRNRVDVDS